MDIATTRLLMGPDGPAALAAAAAEPDPDSLAAATRLRQRFDADLAAAALTQVGLRRRAAAKLGERAGAMLFTRDGLEQATRGRVARWRAKRFRDAGATQVWDLGCGIGADSMALADAGLCVVAIERDEATAALAAHNLADCPGAEVCCADATAIDIPPDSAVYLDPARRDGRGRIWGTDGLQPPWSFVLDLLASGRAACAKVGPGINRALIPGGVCAEWVSDGGEIVECGLWVGGTGTAATLLASDGREHRLTVATSIDIPPARLGDVVCEPDGAAIRARAIGHLASKYALAPVAPGIAYLTGDTTPDSPWLTTFAVRDVVGIKDVRRWCRDHDIGTLEIKKRGVGIDPAHLRRSLKLKGPRAATAILTPTPDGVRAILADRV